MRNVLINSLYIFLCFTILLGCKTNSITTEENIHYIDIVDDKTLEIITIEYDKEQEHIAKIFFKAKTSKDRLISIYPFIDKQYVIASPKVENIYLEGNNIQTSDKGLRIKIRNTDLIPDYFYMDIVLKKDLWHIESVGCINTNPNSELNIKEVKINKPLTSFLGKELECHPKKIFNEYLK